MGGVPSLENGWNRYPPPETCETSVPPPPETLEVGSEGLARGGIYPPPVRHSIQKRKVKRHPLRDAPLAHVRKT